MGWKGTIRSLNATVKRIDRESKRNQRERERESKRRQKELEKRNKELAKMQELEQAEYEVEVYKNYIDCLQSLHKDSSETIDWNSILNQKSPIQPTQKYERMKKSQEIFNNFKPNFFHKLFNRIESKKTQLEENILKSKIEDEDEFKNLTTKYQLDYEEWEENKNLAELILLEDKESIINIIKEFNTFNEIENLGTSILFTFDEENLAIEINVHSKEIIPMESKSLLKSGKLSTKKISKSQYNELYQDYVCSCILRVAREIFALVPLELIIITAKDEILNKSTGHLELQAILSIAISNSSLNTLNMKRIDPSDSMDNFIYNMNFKKTVGFTAVEKISLPQ